jgi:hypothetical protein
MDDVTTLIATVDMRGVSPAALETEVRATLARLGVELIPCGWAPDPDTIAELAGADRLHVIDLNP